MDNLFAIKVFVIASTDIISACIQWGELRENAAKRRGLTS